MGQAQLGRTSCQCDFCGRTEIVTAWNTRERIVFIKGIIEHTIAQVTEINGGQHLQLDLKHALGGGGRIVKQRQILVENPYWQDPKGDVLDANVEKRSIRSGSHICLQCIDSHQIKT